MAVNSVSSSTTANTPSVRSQPQAEQVKPQERPKQQEPAAAPVKNEAQPAAQVQAEAPKPRPVVNTQGQTTGRIISTSA